MGKIIEKTVIIPAEMWMCTQYKDFVISMAGEDINLGCLYDDDDFDDFDNCFKYNIKIEEIGEDDYRIYLNDKIVIDGGIKKEELKEITIKSLLNMI